jgi:hypothetical protein
MSIHLWAKMEQGKLRGAGGHGVMDFFVVHSFVESVKRKTYLRRGCCMMLLVWSAHLHPLSEQVYSIRYYKQSLTSGFLHGGEVAVA